MSNYNYYNLVDVITKDQNDFKIKIFLPKIISTFCRFQFMVIIEHNSIIYKYEINHSHYPLDIPEYLTKHENLYKFIDSIINKNFYINYNNNENYKYFEELLNSLFFVLVVDNFKFEFRIPKNIELTNNIIIRLNNNKIINLTNKINELTNIINNLNNELTNIKNKIIKLEK